MRDETLRRHSHISLHYARDTIISYATNQHRQCILPVHYDIFAFILRVEPYSTYRYIYLPHARGTRHTVLHQSPLRHASPLPVLPRLRLAIIHLYYKLRPSSLAATYYTRYDTKGAIH